MRACRSNRLEARAVGASRLAGLGVAAEGHRQVELGEDHLEHRFDALPGPRGRGPRCRGGRGRTASAPRASALMTSAPLRMPLSKRTVRSSPTASAIGARASSEAIAPSTWRPPWLETTIPSRPRRDRLAGVVDVLDALDQDRQRGQLAQPGEVVPGQRGVDVDAEEVAGRGAEVLLRGLLEAVAEDRVLEEVGDAHPLQEGQPGLLQVARLPAGDEGVDGDDDRAVAGRLGPPDEALDDPALVGPVELEPARRPRRTASAISSRVKCEAVLAIIGTPSGRRRAGGRQLAVLVDDLLDADRRQQQRRRHLGRRAPSSRGRARRRRAASAARSGAARRPRGWRPSCPRSRPRRRRSWPPSPPSSSAARRSSSATATGIDGRLAAQPADVDLAVVSRPGSAIGAKAIRASDSARDRLPHPSLPLRGRGGRASSPRPRRPGCGGCSTSASAPRRNRVALAAAERHEGVFATRRLPPDLGRRIRRRRSRPRSGSWPSTRRCGRSARPGSTTTARPRAASRAAPRLRRPDRDRRRASACRS